MVQKETKNLEKVKLSLLTPGLIDKAFETACSYGRAPDQKGTRRHELRSRSTDPTALIERWESGGFKKRIWGGVWGLNFEP